MPLHPARAKQSTDTTGTGTITLNVAGSTARSFSDVYGSTSTRVLYVISWPGGYEMGFGDFNGGNPGSLTRVDVTRSTNGNALVSLPAGRKDVFIGYLPGQRPLYSISGTSTVTMADLGNVVVFTGTSPATLNLPPVAKVPPGAGLLVVNAGSAVLTIDPSGAETVAGALTYALPTGCSLELIRGLTNWEVAGGMVGWIELRKAVVVGVAAIDFLMPPGFDAFRLTVPAFSVSAPGASMVMRCSSDDGVSWDATSTAYTYTAMYNSVASTAAFSAQANATHLDMTGPLNAGDLRAQLNVLIRPGTASEAFNLTTTGGVVDNTPGFRFISVHGARNATGAKNAVRILSTSGTVTGTFIFEGHRS